MGLCCNKKGVRAITLAVTKRVCFGLPGPLYWKEEAPRKLPEATMSLVFGPLADEVAAFALDHCRDPIHASDRLVLAWPDGERSS